MANQTEEKQSLAAVNTFIWLLVVVLLAAAVVGNQYLTDILPRLYRILALVGTIGVAVGLAAFTVQGSAFRGLLKDARIEVRKVVWPTRQETTQTTLVIIAVVLFVSLILWGLDSLLGFIVARLIG